MRKTCILIDGCRCKKLSFQDILKLAANFSYNLNVTTLATGAGTDCGTCYPWLKEALLQQQSQFFIELNQENKKLALHFGITPCPKK